MSRKPESVRKNAEAANAAISELNNTAAEGNDTPIDATVQPGEQAKQPAGTPETTPASDQHQQLDKPLGNDGDPWEQRYKILQGKYNKEVPALHEQVRELKARLSEAGDNQEVSRLRTEIADLKRRLEAAPSQQQQKPTNSADLDKLREQYPADLVDGILAVVQSMVAPIQQRVDSVNETVSQSSKTSNVDRLRSALKDNGIDFDQLNTDPLFVQDFLGELAPYSDKTKGQLLTEAFDSGDIGRAARFFIDYAGSRGVDSGAPKSKDIGKHVQVPTSSGSEKVSTSGMVWNDQSIAQFYEDRRRGKYTPEEGRALELEIYAFINR
ncbi:MAG: hypothetical protein KKD00_04205 [Gammaproteobacteria bacterium]|nr:hypothetical protein [Gammaproteobacteria bacterium]